jgi:ferric-dicitrate binding protein FerR (iron transport regulator)
MTTEWRYLLSLALDGESLSDEEGAALASSLRFSANVGEALNCLKLESALRRLHHPADRPATLRSCESLLAKALLREKRRTHRIRSSRRLPLARIAAAASFLFAAAAVVLLAFRGAPTVIVPARPSPLATIASSEDARIAHPDGMLSPATPGTPLHAGDRISTGLGGSIRLFFENDPTRIVLGGATALRLLPDNPGRRLHLDIGTLSATVAPQPAERPLVILTPHSESTVLGTSLALSTGYDRTRLSVTEGKVRLERMADRASVLVPAGHAAIADRSAVTPLRIELIDTPTPPRADVLSPILLGVTVPDQLLSIESA